MFPFSTVNCLFSWTTKTSDTYFLIDFCIKQQGKSSLCSQASSFPQHSVFLVSSQARLMQIRGKWDLCQCLDYLILSVDSQLWWFLLPVCLP